MRKIAFRSIAFTSYALAIAVLATAYMGDNTYLLNFYILPILFGAYYFDLYGATAFIFISSGLSLLFMHNAGKPIGDAPLIIQIVIFAIVGVVAGIFQRENNRLNNYLLKASLTDKLTDLYNYGYFTKRIEEEVARADRYKHSVALVIIDIDHFKKYNDTYGHQKGNQVLVKLSQIIMENRRRSDIAFRYGGEEFCIILPETEDGAPEFAERLRKKVEAEEFPGKVKVRSFGSTLARPIKRGGASTASEAAPVCVSEATPVCAEVVSPGMPGALAAVKITISAGVSCHPCKNKNIGLVERADMALYEAKETGRNKVCVYKG